MTDLFFNDIKTEIDNGFTESGWVMVFSLGQNFKDVEQAGVYSALVSPDKAKEALTTNTWEMRYGEGRPGFTFRGFGKTAKAKYNRFSKKGFEPLVLYREQFGNYDNYLEFSEEFRLFHNLYERFTSQDQKEYIFIDSNGDEEVAARIGRNEAFVKLSFLKDYISARGMDLLIYFDFMRFTDKPLSELQVTEPEKYFSGDKYFYRLIVREIDGLLSNERTQGWIMGKCIMTKIKGYKPELFGNMDIRDEYAEFSYDFDENGKEKYFTCNEDKLANYFVEKGNAPLYVTPIYFSREVLKKYYDNPGKYTVSDGQISCNSVWSLRLDNSCKDYVIVLLGDLGKLHHKEQLYWKSFNIPPRKEGFSYTAYKRFFEGEPCDPVHPELYLKMSLEQFNKRWEMRFGWHLFRPLSGEDDHYLKGLHLLTSKNNEKEFDEQILALAKIFIDSLNEAEMSRSIALTKENAKGLDKLEAFLQSMDISIPDMLKFFRSLQSLRSSTVAHRRSTNRADTKRTLEYFHIGEKDLNIVLEEIFLNLIRSLKAMEEVLLKKEPALTPNII